MAKQKKKKSSKIPIPILVIIYGVLLYATYQSVSSIVLALFGQTTTGYVDYYSNTIEDRSADAGRSRSIIKGYYFYVGDKTYRGRVSYSSDESWPSLKEGETRPESIRYLGFFPYINSTASLADFDSMSGGQIFATIFVPFGCFGLFMLLHTSNKRAKKKDREAAERAAKREARKAINTDKDDGGLFCEKCGAKVTAGAEFCISCGTKIQAAKPSVCASCGAALPDEAVFCINCGTAADAAAPASR